MENGFDIRDILAIVKRRWWIPLIPVVLLTPVALLIAYALPPVYQATTRILVESQQIPEGMVQSTITVGVDERIALIEQRLMTRQNLLDIANRFNVTANREDMSPTEIVDLMRDATTIEGIRLSGRRGPVTGINIAFTADRARLSADVANEFARLLLEQNIEDRTDRAFETSAYFRQEVRRLGQALEAQEARITEYKLANDDALPDSLSFRRTELARLQERVFERELRQVALNDELQRLEQALERGEFAAIGGETTPEEQELVRLQRALVQQTAIYAPSHPSIRSLQSRIRALEAQLRDGGAVEAGAQQADGAEQGGGSATERTIQAIRDQLALIEERRAAETQRIEALEDSIARTPDTELELNGLMRELSALRAQYDDAVIKSARAETGERLEVNQQAERFEVLETAQVPPSPTSPNRPLIAAAGFVGSLGLGCAIVLLLELLDNRVRTPRDLERRFDIIPLATIPYIRTHAQIFRRKLLLRGGALAVVGGVAALLFLVDRQVPLPLLMDRVMDKTGLARLIEIVGQRFS